MIAMMARSMNIVVTIGFFCILICGLVFAKVGQTFSCNHNETKIVTYDIVDVGSCDPYEDDDLAPDPYLVQIFQKIGTKHMTGNRCKLEVCVYNLFLLGVDIHLSIHIHNVCRSGKLR